MGMACGGLVAKVAMGSSIVLAADAPESLAQFYGALLAGLGPIPAWGV